MAGGTTAGGVLGLRVFCDGGSWGMVVACWLVGCCLLLVVVEFLFLEHSWDTLFRQLFENKMEGNANWMCCDAKPLPVTVAGGQCYWLGAYQASCVRLPLFLYFSWTFDPWRLHRHQNDHNSQQHFDIVFPFLNLSLGWSNQLIFHWHPARSSKFTLDKKYLDLFFWWFFLQIPPGSPIFTTIFFGRFFPTI